ncbi:collagen alpha-1 chain-like [Stylonychia lemnae]|uniref:Collagen alpha-1 chain-like n=1 Tax=Stylonychia lemnae TaxID=5949 RepID=A0A077ZQS7_STYLE|nr:collagen alpha-1 chain-like [Stylonychia lemnae]|eukprot:CDW72283.1 collagen alpha-1 chain-like [Stylonychia lemnae]
MLIRNLIIGFSLLQLVSLQEYDSQDCYQCSIQPCGCKLFKCSQGPIYPEGVEDLSRGFTGCQALSQPFVNAVIIQKLQGTCLCPYVNVDKNCKPIGDKRIMIGSGFDLTMSSSDILDKLKPFQGIKENPIKFIQESKSLELTLNEVQTFDLVLMGSEVLNMGKYYNSNYFNAPSIYGKLNPQKPNFEELTRGIRTLFYSFQRQYGSPSNYQRLWNYALRANYSQIMKELEREAEHSNRKHIEAQILKYCLEKCSESNAANIMFVIDGSWSIKIENYNTQKQFMVNLLESMKIEKDQQEAALVLFSNQVELKSDFSGDKVSLINTVRLMHYPNSDTQTDLALVESAKIFKGQIQKRPNVINLLFILTDGQPSVPINQQSIDNLKELNIKTFAIGIGPDIKNETLAYLSGDNATDYSRVYQVSQFDKLKQLLNSINQLACSTPTEIDFQINNLTNIVLDDTGAQYFVLLQKYVYLRIDLSKYIVQSNTSGDSSNQNAQSQLQNNENEVELYYSFTEELPNQFVNDGKGKRVGDSVEAVIVNNATNKTFFAVKQTKEMKSQAKLHVQPLVFDHCSVNCVSCLNENICKTCSEGFVLLNDKCVKPSINDNPYIGPILAGVVSVVSLGGYFTFGRTAAVSQIQSNSDQHEKND